jgi:tetratricopeptide (TPR) repeat protein
MLRQLIATTDAMGLDANSLLANEARTPILISMYRQNRLEEALDIAQRILAWQLESLPSNHPWILRMKGRIVDLEVLIAPSPEAIARQRALIDEFAEALGEDSAMVAVSRSNVADTLRRQGRYDEAIEEYRKAFVFLSQIRGRDHLSIVQLSIGFADALLSEGSRQSLAEATVLVDESYKIARARWGANSPITMNAMMKAARARNLLSRREEAAAILLDSAHMNAGFEARESTIRLYLAALENQEQELECANQDQATSNYCLELRARKEILRSEAQNQDS